MKNFSNSPIWDLSSVGSIGYFKRMGEVPHSLWKGHVSRWCTIEGVSKILVELVWIWTIENRPSTTSDQTDRTKTQFRPIHQIRLTGIVSSRVESPPGYIQNFPFPPSPSSVPPGYFKFHSPLPQKGFSAYFDHLVSTSASFPVLGI